MCRAGEGCCMMHALSFGPDDEDDRKMGEFW